MEIKVFNVLIDGKSFFDLPVKMKKKLTSRNNDYTTGNLFGFCLFQRKLQINCDRFE